MSEKNVSLTTYTIPVSYNGALTFSAKGAFIQKAILRINERVMSIVWPKYDYKYRAEGYESDEKLISAENCNEAEVPPEVDLDFLGNVPLQCGLLSKCNITVIMHCVGRNYPSLTFAAVDGLSWDDIIKNDSTSNLSNSNPEHTEIVVAGSDSGPKKYVLVYMPNTCGYRALDSQ